MAPPRTLIIAEAGSNWRMGTPERDLKMAKTLIEVAAEAGADAVKFQSFRTESIYVPEAGESDYLSDVGIKQSINAIFDDMTLPHEWLPILAEHCRQLGVQFMSTPFSVADAQAVDPYVQIHKLASYEINHVRLLQWLARTGKPLIMSTGAASVADIEFGLATAREAGARDITLMQCTAAYPAPPDSLNLKALTYLKETFGVATGLSDHSQDPIVAPVAAVALGATVIEKHFTLHRRLPGPDHPFALEPHELQAMIRAIRLADVGLGEAHKDIQPQEQELQRFAVRAIQAIRDIQPGDALVEGVNIDVLRPGKRSKGLHPKYLDRLAGQVARRAIARGEGIDASAVDLGGHDHA